VEGMAFWTAGGFLAELKNIKINLSSCFHAYSMRQTFKNGDFMSFSTIFVLSMFVLSEFM